jgi:DNA-binding MarR family transcriptional regulator
MDPDQELYVVLQRAADWLMQDVQSLLKGHGLSHQQYNVLRILRGVKGPLNCTEIANRMINRDPDMTRLLDRMETRGWIERARAVEDRRVVLASITESGMALLAELDEPVTECHRRQFSGLDAERKARITETLKLLLG